MIKQKKLFLVFAILTMILSLLVGTSFAQNSGSKTKKKTSPTTKSSSSGKTKKRAKTAEKEVVYKTIDRRSRALQGNHNDDSDKSKSDDDKIKISPKATAQDSTEIVDDKPTISKLKRAGSFTGDLRDLPYVKPIFRENWHARSGANEILVGDPVEVGSALTGR